MKMLSGLLAFAALSFAFDRSPAAGEKEKVIEREDVTMGALPADVRSALREEAQGGRIQELKRDYLKDDTVRYEADIVLRGGDISHVEVSPNGRILEREEPGDRSRQEKR